MTLPSALKIFLAEHNRLTKEGVSYYYRCGICFNSVAWKLVKLQWRISGRSLITSIYTHCHRAINQADIKKNAVEFHDWLKAGDTFKETNNVLKFSQVSVTHITLLPKVIYLCLTVLQLLLNGHHCLVGLTG